jgi:hypothetical protein
MKKYLFLLVLCIPIFTNAQLSTFIDAAQNYNDANIINNFNRQVTPLKVNTTFDKVLDALKFIDTAAKFNEDPSWNILGNSGTSDALNFIGTKDNVPFNIRVNNQKSGRIDPTLVNTSYGYLSLSSNVGGNYNTAVGGYSLNNNTSGSENTAIGVTALDVNTTGSYNTAIGRNSLHLNSGGAGNTATGFSSSIANQTGNYNASFGTNSLLFNTAGSYNSAFGLNSLKTVSTGNYNTGFGYLADVSTGTLINATAIGANSYVTASNSLVLGSINGTNGAISDSKVGIGITAPTERLHIVGNLRLVNGSQSAGRFLQTDANGVATWVDALALITASNGLTKTGNDIKLGGALTENTTLEGGGTKSIVLDNVSEFVVSSNNIQMGSGGGVNNLYGSWEVDELLKAFQNFEVNDSSTFHGYGLLDKKFNYKTNINGTLDPLSLVPKLYIDSVAALKQNDLGYTPENVANKENGTIDNNITKYPTINLLKTGLDTKLDVGTTTTDIPEGTNQYFTSEKAQDATGSMVDATIVYNDGIPSLGRAAIDGDIAISAGSNTAALTAGVIVNADINAAAAIDATKLIDGSISNTELGYINTLTSNAQTQLTNLNSNKVTKGGDTGPLTIGTTDVTDLVLMTGSNSRWRITGGGNLIKNVTSSSFGLHLGGTGFGAAIAFGDTLALETPYGMIRERNGTDTDQGQFYFQKGEGFFTGTLDNIPELWVNQSGNTVIGGETEVAGNKLTVIGNEDVSGNLNVQGNLTAGNILSGSAVLNFPSTLATAVSDLTIVATGAAVGDPVFIGVPNGSVTATATYWAWVSSANTITVRFSPKNTEDPSSNTFKYRVFK